MTFLSPFWLLALLPWTAVAIWSLVRRGRRVDVPFVALWRTTAVAPARRGMRRPPAAVLLLLLASLLAILAAAGPALRGGGGGSVTVVVDRGVTMSAGLRYRATTDDVVRALSARGVATTLVPVPAMGSTPARAADIPPTAVDTRELLASAVALATAGGEAVVVVTDQDVLAIDGTGAARAAPPPAADRVAIAIVAARAAPAGQVMVRLRNASNETTADVEVSSDAVTKRARVDLPPRGQWKDYFVDVDPLGGIVAVTVGDERAWLARRPRWPRVSADGPVSPAVERAIAAYAAARPPDADAPTVVVTTAAPGPAGAAGAGAVIVVATGASSPVVVAPVVVDDPLTRDVNWPALAAGGTVAGRPPAGWSPLVTAGDAVLLAAAPEPARQAWVGVWPSSDSPSVDWVILWTRLFDHLGAMASDGAGVFAATEPALLGDGWERVAGDEPAGTERGFWPGPYRHADGRVRAVNAPDVVPGSASSTATWDDARADALPWRTAPVVGRRFGPGLAVTSVLATTVAAWLVASSVRAGRRRATPAVA